MGLDQYLNRIYKRVSFENVDAYLEAMEVPESLRSLITSSPASVSITGGNGTYTIKTSMAMRDHQYTFTPGVEFEDVGIDGKNYRCLITIDGNKTINEIKSNPPSTITNVFSGDQLHVTLKTGDVTATQIFEAA